MFTKFRTLASQSLVYAVGDILNLGFVFLLIPLYTTFLSPADYGILAITSTVASVLSVLYLQSLEGAITRFHYDYSDPVSRKGYYGTVWILMVGFTLVTSLLLAGIGNQVAPLLFTNIPYTPYLSLVVWTTFITNSSLVLLLAVLRVQERPFAYITLNLATFLVNITLVIYFVADKGQGAFGSLLGKFLGSLILAVPITVIYLRNAKLQWSWTQAKASLAFALPLIPHLLSLWVLNLSDRIVLQKYVSLDQVGIYNLGYQLSSIVQLIAFSLANAWGPFYYKMANTQDGPVVLSRMSTYYWLVVIMVGTGLAITAKDILMIIPAQPEYRVAYQMVPIVILGLTTRAFYFIFVSALYYQKRVKVLPLVTIIAGALNIGLNLLFVPKYGYMAAAVNTFIAYTFQTIVMYFLAQRAFWMPYEYSRAVKLVAVGIALYYVNINLPETQVWVGLSLKTGIILTYPLWLALLRFWTPDEIQVWHHTLRNFSPMLFKNLANLVSREQ
ncbi:MAG: polysaccharide biosynthesis protein [Chloroflexota bacterium]|nr:MAG: polysaccharide biosynthesis protein [Chloroflexota bacterium]